MPKGIPNKKVIKLKEVPVVPVVPVVVEEKPVEDAKTVADLVVMHTGEVMLTYTKEANGEDWVELATNMAKRKGWKVNFR